MTIDDCYEIGYVSKTHGVGGEVVINLDVDTPERYVAIHAILIRGNDLGQSLIPFTVKKWTLRHTGTVISALVKIEDMESVSAANQIRGTKVYLPLSSLPPLEGHQFYYHEIIGFAIVDQSLGRLGTIKDIYSSPGQDIIAMSYNNTEVLINISDHTVIRCDRQQNILVVNLPEGLLELYLES